jgi:glucose-6-phosphate 1-dehydrogenase
MSNIISVSLTTEQAVFLQEMELSPSKMLQSAIQDAIESHKVSAKQVEELNRRIVFLQGTIDKQRNFIETQNLMDKFINL